MAQASLIPIPRFALYGETGPQGGLGAADEAAFVHIETIRERSVQHDWEIKPHRHGWFYQILFLASGRAVVSIDGQKRTAEGPALVVVPPGMVHGFRFDPSVEGKVLTLSADFAHRAMGAADPLLRLLGRGGVLMLEEGQAARLDGLAEEMLRVQGESGGGPSPDKPSLLLALAESWVRLAAHFAAIAASGSGDDLREARLQALIESHFRQQRPAGFYAGALGITVRTLSRLCQRLYGCAPKALLHRRLALEASRLLLYTNATAAQVAEELGFDDPSYFSRFYLRMTGQRPQAILERRRDEAAITAN